MNKISLCLLQDRMLNYKIHNVLKELYKRCVVDNKIWSDDENFICKINKFTSTIVRT